MSTLTNEIVRKYESYLLLFCSFLTRDYHRMSDLAQEVWLRILRYRVRLPQRESNAFGLLAAMARNAYRDELKRRRPGCSLSRENEPAAENSDAEKADQLRWINEVISSLPLQERVVIRLRLGGGLGLRDVAETLGIPFGTAKKRYHRAVRRLQNKVPQHLC